LLQLLKLRKKHVFTSKLESQPLRTTGTQLGELPVDMCLKYC